MVQTQAVKNAIRATKPKWGFTELSAKHHRVIDNFFMNGRNKTRAMADAGYKPSSAKANSWAFFKNKAIQTEIEKREKELAERYDISKEWIVERLARIADSGKTMSKFRKVDPATGQIYQDFTDATREDLEIIADLSVEEYKEGRGPGAVDIKKTKITVQSPQQALDSLARLLGYNQDKVTIEGEFSVVEQLQSGRKRIQAIRHAPTNVIDAEYSEIGQKALEKPKEEAYKAPGEREAVPVPDEDEDLIPW